MSGSGVKTRLKRLARPLGSIVATTSPHVVLTYDDGPDPTATPGILDALAGSGAGATFFVLLTRARRDPGIVRAAADAGHDVGLHGLDHTRLTTLAPDDVRRRTAEAKAELEDLTGRPVRWFRPPYGAQSIGTWRAVRSTGLTPVFWNASTWDWRDISQDERVSAATGRASAGSVLLAHDGYADETDGADDGPAPAVDRVDLCRRLLVAFEERSLSCVSLSQALEGSSPVLEATFVK